MHHFDILIKAYRRLRALITVETAEKSAAFRESYV